MVERPSLVIVTCFCRYPPDTDSGRDESLMGLDKRDPPGDAVRARRTICR